MEIFMFLSFFCALLGSSSLAVLVKAHDHSGKIEERIAFFKVVQSEKQSIYHGYVTDLTAAELVERLKNGSLSLRFCGEEKWCIIGVTNSAL
ncbi:hypothetical protein Ddye_014408 [Dipteronia dyeriana]|uniref:Uncharacterized protein n=1 Tax=Dipteronia dyeriana TaxID=168575 RepID=A0AAE0CKJ5_9ROSI|nr:hypothetical protein Ddye_014408 [Dipteronia dyeriana]